MRLYGLFQAKRKIPKVGQSAHQRTILILCALSLLFFLLARYVPFEREDGLKNEMKRASEIMAEALVEIKKCQKEKGISIDKKTDINETGLIGVEFSSITTSLGSLKAKRTTTNPNVAALIVYLLNRAGVKQGDAIAVGASSSFPALIMATFSAAKAMNLKPLMICSLGASQWGANLPDFHWLCMQDCLQRAGILTTPPIALSLGGEKDTGTDMSPEGRSLLLCKAQESGILFLNEPNLRQNVEKRMRLYEEISGEEEIEAFINIGGNLSNMGTDSEVLKLKPGLISLKHIPPDEKRGVIHEMALRKIPIIHLLYIRGLVRRYKLPWDPSPLPKPGEGKVYQLTRAAQVSFLIIACLYILCVILVISFKIIFKVK